MENRNLPVPAEGVDRLILLVRGRKVILDMDIATLYGVETRIVNQAVRRNIDRFPEDFMFQLTWEETELLNNNKDMGSRSQFVILNRGRNIKYRPFAFTEEGVAMLSSVLKSPRAVSVNIEIMRAFVRLRQLLSTHSDLARKLAALEKKYDSQFKIVFDAIREMMTPHPGTPLCDNSNSLGVYVSDEYWYEKDDWKTAAVAGTKDIPLNRIYELQKYAYSRFTENLFKENDK